MKNEKCIGVSCITFFGFHISQCFMLGSAFAWKLKDFKFYFFAALIKHEFCTKCEKCIVSVSYFTVCFVKTFAKCEIRKVYSWPYKGLYGVSELTHCTDTQCIKLTKEKNSVFCGSVCSEQYAVSERSRNTAGFITRVVPTLNKH